MDRRSRGCSAGSWRQPVSSSSAALRVGSTARRTAARSRPAAARWPCSAAASTATTRPPTPQLAARVCEDGLVVSEYAPGVEPAPWRFPARNRIIAGLAVATTVVEARERSGSLITADFALEAGREVFAVPGEITSALSAGANALLRLGATPLTSAEDVLESLGVEAAAPVSAELGETPRRVLEALGREPSGVDGLVRETGLDAAAVATALAELELAGAVAEAEGLYRGVRPQG